MIARLNACNGISADLPLLLSWELTRTGAVPCDSFSITCPFDTALWDILRNTPQLTLVENGSIALRGVVDDYTVSINENGKLLLIHGRGLAALLLDNETESFLYQCATNDEILKNHVLPYGISCTHCDSIRANVPYTVASGSSQWKALSDFCRIFGGCTPYFAADGTLSISKNREAKTLSFTDSSALHRISFQEKRYGVLSEVLLIEKSGGQRELVRNQEFAARGGCRRRVIYAPANSGARSMRFDGSYQIHQSAQEQFSLSLVLPGTLPAEPGDLLSFDRSDIDLHGSFRIREITDSMSDQKGRCTSILLTQEV